MVIFGACGSFKPIDGYRVVASCDPYNARKHYHGEAVVRREGATPVEWVVRSGLTRERANDVIFRFVRESCGRYFANWGLAVIGAKKAAQGVDCWTGTDGLRGMTDDTMTYRVEKEGRA